MAKIFNVPFATLGDVEEIPQDAQADNAVSYAEGYTEDYALDPATDPAAKDIERAKFNSLMNAVTAAIFEIQRHGAALWGEAGKPYPANARVYHDGAIWTSPAGNNNETPGEGNAWQLNRVLFSTETQALAGEDNTTAMTPLRAHQAFNQYGLGADVPSVTLNIDDLDIPSGDYYIASASTGTKPTGESAGHLSVVWRGTGSGRSINQVWRPFAGTPRVWVRLSSGEQPWTPWRELFTTGNQLTLGTTAASGRTALGINAANTPYDNTDSPIEGDDVQAGLDQVSTRIPINAAGTSREITPADYGTMLNVPGSAPGDVTFTLPDPATAGVPLGTLVFFFNGSTPKAVINPTYAQAPEGKGFSSRGERCTIGAIARGTVWSLFGDLADA